MLIRLRRKSMPPIFWLVANSTRLIANRFSVVKQRGRGAPCSTVADFDVQSDNFFWPPIHDGCVTMRSAEKGGWEPNVLAWQSSLRQPPFSAACPVADWLQAEIGYTACRLTTSHGTT